MNRQLELEPAALGVRPERLHDSSDHGTWVMVLESIVLNTLVDLREVDHPVDQPVQPVALLRMMRTYCSPVLRKLLSGGVWLRRISRSSANMLIEDSGVRSS